MSAHLRNGLLWVLAVAMSFALVDVLGFVLHVAVRAFAFGWGLL